MHCIIESAYQIPPSVTDLEADAKVLNISSSLSTDELVLAEDENNEIVADTSNEPELNEQAAALKDYDYLNATNSIDELVLAVDENNEIVTLKTNELNEQAGASEDYDYLRAINPVVHWKAELAKHEINLHNDVNTNI